MREAAGESGALTRPYLVAAAGHGQRDRPGLDPDHLPGGRRVRVTAEPLAWLHHPAPELGRPGRIRGRENRAGPACLAAPEHPGPVRACDPYGGFVRHVDHAGDRHPERVGDTGQGGQVRVGAPLLQRHQHALANTGPEGELVQGPAALGPQRLQDASERAGQVGWLLHRHRPPAAVALGRYTELVIALFRPGAAEAGYRARGGGRASGRVAKAGHRARRERAPSAWRKPDPERAARLN